MLHLVYESAPPNKWLQLTGQLVTPFACAKGAPSCLAAEPGCYTALTAYRSGKVDVRFRPVPAIPISRSGQQNAHIRSTEKGIVMLEQVAGFAELVGAVGVVLSLLYVGKQLKQTNKMSRSAARQSMSTQMNDWSMAIAASPSLSEAFSKVHFHNLVRDGATDLERIQVAYAFVGLIGQIHFAYEQQQEGIFTQKELDDVHGPGTTLLRQPYLASLWPILRPGYPQDFGRWFERRYNVGASDESGAVHR